MLRWQVISIFCLSINLNPAFILSVDSEENIFVLSNIWFITFVAAKSTKQRRKYTKSCCWCPTTRFQQHHILKLWRKFLLEVIDFSPQVHVLQLMNDKLSTGFTEEEVSSSQIDFNYKFCSGDSDILWYMWGCSQAAPLPDSYYPQGPKGELFNGKTISKLVH